MAEQYQENKLYQNVGNIVQSVGKAAAAARKSAKSFNTQKYNNVSNAVGTVGNAVGNVASGALNKLKSLGTITTQYGGSTNYEKFHPAIDIANKIGTPIPAFSGGKVLSVTTGLKQGDKGYGNNVIIQDAQGRQWRYSHLAGAYVKAGQTITPGSIIGAMGNTGSTYSTSGGTGSHLDLRIKDAYNNYINPFSIL